MFTRCLAALVAIGCLSLGARADDAAAARALLDQVAATYRAAPAFTDHARVTYVSNQGPNTYDYHFAFDANNAEFLLPGFEIRIVDGTMYVLSERASHKYLAAPTNGADPGTAYRQTLRSTLPLSAALRAGGPDDHVSALTLGKLQDPKLAGVTNGAEGREILVAAANGEGRFIVDPASKMLKGLSIKYTTARTGAQEFTASATFSPALHSTLPKPVTFTPGNRYRVPGVAQLFQTSRGEPAPDFTLTTQAGDAVTLSQLRGSVVVLDFWATWCGPCKRGLPLLDRFHRNAEASGRLVRVFAVNIMERFPSVEQRVQQVTQYWSQQNFDVPTLLDLDNSVAGQYGFRSIPVTVVVAPDGTIDTIHTGFDPRMEQVLEADVNRLLGAGG